MWAGAAAGAAALVPSAFVPSAFSSALDEVVPRALDTLSPDAPVRPLSLVAQEQTAPLLGPGKPATAHFCSFNGTPFLTLRAPQGSRLMVDFENRLPGPTTVHFHGIRGPYIFDGVPPITQPLVPAGGRFTYNVPLPDAGFYFFHPHCDETGQVGRGLVGLLFVEPPAERQVRFDLEHVIVVKDWRLDEAGQWLPQFTDDGASTAGSFGTVRAVNGAIMPPRIEAPAYGDVRVRAIVADSTRVIDFGCDSDEAAVIACDGQATHPFLLNDAPDGVWRMGPAMRLDVHVRMPAPGQEVKIYDYRTAEPYLLTTLVAADKGRRKAPFKPKALPEPTELPLPDLAHATRLEFLLQTAAGATAVAPPLPAGDPLAQALVSSLCVGSKTFWAINRNSWGAGADLRLPPPLSILRNGDSYILAITNATKHVHPMHLHGHVFRVLSSSKKKQLPQFLADTVLVEPNETVEVAFKATSGNWVFHCHILEHMDAGLMGWFRVA